MDRVLLPYKTRNKSIKRKKIGENKSTHNENIDYIPVKM